MSKDEDDSDSAASSPLKGRDSGDDEDYQKTSRNISKELVELGIYALSVKPQKDWLKQGLSQFNYCQSISFIIFQPN